MKILLLAPKGVPIIVQKGLNKRPAKTNHISIKSREAAARRRHLCTSFLSLQSTTQSIPNTSFMAIDLNLLPEGDREAIPDLNEVVGGEESAASGEQDAINHGGNNEIVGEEEDPSIVVQEADAHGSGGQCLQHFDLNVEPDMFEEFNQGMY